MFLHVAVEGVSKILTYAFDNSVVSDNFDLVGSFVVAPLKNRVTDGIVISYAQPPSFETKVIKDKPLKVFKSDQIKSLITVAKFYFEDIFTVSSNLAPPVLRWRGIKSLQKSIQNLEFVKPKEITLNNTGKILSIPQAGALEKIIQCSQKKILLRGETGSGKTEIYIELARSALVKGEGVLILVPEISLTPEISRRFCDAVPKKYIAILHSDMTRQERYKEWMEILRAEKLIVIGTRSSVMAPVYNLKYIVVDEEHDRSYKQADSGFKYHACQICEIRSEIEGAKVIFGSATPRLETYYSAKVDSSWLYIYLPPFSKGYSKVLVDVIDMRKVGKAAKGIAFPVLKEIEDTLSKKEQVIIFYNRVGYCWSLYCPKCGYSSKCPNCSLALRVIKSKNKQYCSVCGFTREIERNCPDCRSPLLFVGSGTEQIFEQVERLFPLAKVVRVDKEAVINYAELFQILDDFANGKIDILVSTQLISKGHNFKNLALIVAANPDIGRNIPDFRSSEYFIQLFYQLSGRLGRAGKPGKIMIQTYFPNDPAFTFLKKREIEKFYDSELEIRRRLNLPPFNLFVRFLATNEKSIDRAMLELKKLKDFLQSFTNYEILGPTPCYYNKIKGAFRAHMIIKFSDRLMISELMNKVKDKLPKSVMYDIDPIDII